MGLTSRLLVSGIAAGAALAYYTRRRHQRTGESYLDIVKQLPSEAQRWATDTRERAARALEDGKAAARAREHTISGRLEAVREPAVPGR